MRRELLDLLCCPDCGRVLELIAAHVKGPHIEQGRLRCVGCGCSYPIVGYVPRFVRAEHYTSSFGFEWARFRKTQLDSHTGRPISRQRFFHQTGWRPEELAGKTVLDVGCGAGRFAEVALSCGAVVVAVDYSKAADVCWQNLGIRECLDVVQADIYRLPFKPGQFDFVYCFGVLQHTPDPRRAFMAMPTQLAVNGRLAMDIYPRQARNLLWPKYWLRVLTRHLPPEQVFGFARMLVALLWPVSLAIGRLPLLGRKLRHVVPVANYEGIYPLSSEQLREWALLDTFDMLAPRYDHPQSAKTVTRWFAATELQDVVVFRAGHLVGRGVKRHQH